MTKMNLKEILELYNSYSKKEFDIEFASVNEFRPSGLSDKKWIADLYQTRYNNYLETKGANLHYKNFVNNLKEFKGDKVRGFVLTRNNDIILIFTDDEVNNIIGILKSTIQEKK